MNPGVDPPPALSLGLYRALLILYPRRFRERYAPHMVQLFGDSLRDARDRGRAGVARLWLETLVDLLKSALEERLRKGFTMTREGFVRLSGPLLMMAGALLLTTLLSGLETRWDDPLGGPDLLPELAGMLWAPAMLLIVAGLVGVWLLHGERLGSFGRFALVGAGLGALVGAGGVVVMGLDLARIVRSEFGWTLFVLGLFVLLGSLVLLGLVALAKRPLPRGNALPLVIGLLPWPVQWLGDGYFAFFFGLFAVGWALYGYAIHREASGRADTPAVA